MASVQDYTPAELLQFGQRAEADGNLDYALRIYAYLANNFPDTAEGELGFDGYGRVESTMSEMAGTPAPSRQRPSHAQAAAQTQPPAQPKSLETYQTPTQPPPTPQPMPLSDRLASLTGTAARSPTPTRGATAQRSGSKAGEQDREINFQFAREYEHPTPALYDDKNADDDASPLEDDDTVLPRMVARALEESEGDLEESFQNRYRAGSIIAITFAVVGWVMLALGLAVIGLTLSGTFPALQTIGVTALVPLGIEFGIGIAAVGLILVFLSQLGSAVIDNANATRHLLALERAKAGF